jgi:hypothetical protein
MKRIFIASLLLLGVAVNGKAQSVNTSDPAFKAKAMVDIEEVYQGYPQYMTPTHIQAYEENLSRVEIKQQPIAPNENYPLLSSIILKNKYNTAMVRDYASNFNAATFNPLKYFFEFYAKQEKIYRVDDSPYIIVVHPKQ